MSSQQLNVSLAFTADTKQAVAAVKSLRQELNNLATGKNLKDAGLTRITPEIQKAMIAAGELQSKLEQATNIKTGKLDLGLFQDSLKKSGVTLQEYAQQLSTLGPAGTQAFNNLAKSVISAEMPIIRCSNRLKEFGTTLKNTAKWQISSSMLHGFMGAIQSAYGYAQDLNESLNNIRIVTGQSIDQMSKFAEQANKAAKALSTTTTEYTNASLIYYQQGLSDSEVQKRTDVTIKMANAAGQSAEVVSDQLTSIWNNFYDGSKSLEYYADVMTALGAATASSTDEIAGGLEKFAAIGETIGLSYEYAAAALATITSNTRQSEEVVGTALKTIFARIQGLKLGETLEDDVDLNKYSEALQAVGISIFDQKGELKDMDNILKEMAATWDTLSNRQQVALAQTVAGTRQYTHLISLMKYWDNGDNDSMMANLETAYGSTGALQEQADIYAESWEAARDRVTASAEAIYTKVFNDETFISMLDGVAKAIDGIGSMIDSLGGLKGVLLTVGAIASRIFNNEIAQGARNAFSTMKQLIPFVGKKENQKTKEDAIEAMASIRSSNSGYQGEAENTAMQREVEMQKQLLAAEKNLSAEELKQLQIQMDLVKAMDQRAITAAKALDVAKNELKVLQEQNRIRTKMDTQQQARKKGEIAAGEKLVDKTTLSKEKGGFNDVTADFIISKYMEAEQNVRSSHGLDSTRDSLRGYENEINKELTTLVMEALKDTDLKIDKNSIEQLINDEIKEAIEKANIDQVGRNVDKVQKQVQAAGSLKAQGQALQKVGTDLKTTDSNGQVKSAKELEQIYQQVKIRIAETTKSAIDLNKELGKKGGDKNLNALIGLLKKLNRELDESQGDAAKLQQILKDIAAVQSDIDLTGTNSIGETVQGIATNINGEVQEKASNTFNQSSFNLDGQFEGAVDAERGKIGYQNAEADTGDVAGKFGKSLSGATVKDWADGIATATNVIMSLGAVISSVQGAVDVFNNPDATAWDKISAIIGVLVTVLPTVTSLMTAFGTSAAAAGASAAAAGTSASAAGMAASTGLAPIMPIVLGITVAVVALTAAFTLLADHLHDISPEGQLEKAQKTAEELEGTLEKTKQEAADLKSSFDKYSSVSDKLKDCVKGTEEWNTALQEVNSEVIDLLQKYPELSTMTNDFGESAIFRDPETGALQIQDWAIEQLTIQVENAIINTQTASVIAQQTVNEKRAEVVEGELKDIIFDFNTHISDYSGRQDENGKWESAANLFYNYLIENIEEFYGKKDDELKEIVTNWVKDNNIKDIITEENVDDEYIQNLFVLVQNYSDLINEYKELLDSNDRSRQLYNDTITGNIFADNEVVQNSQYRDNIVDSISGKILDRLKQEADPGTSFGSKITAENDFDSYATSMGWTPGSYDYTEVKDGKFHFTHNGVDDSVDIDVAKSMVIAAEATQNAIKRAGELVEIFGGKTEDQVNKITAALTQNADYIKVGDADKELSVDSEKFLSEDDLLALGYEGDTAWKDFINDYNEVIRVAGDRINSIIQDYTKSVSSSLNGLINKDTGKLTDLTAGQLSQVGDILQTALNEGGEETLTSFVELFQKMGSEGTKKMLEAFNGVDWSNLTIDELRTILNDSGIAVGFTNDELSNMITVMKELKGAAGDASKNLEGLIEQVKELKQGDIISEEDYEKYYKGKGLDQYFQVMENGNRRLIANAQEFYGIVSAMTIGQKKDDISQLQGKRDNLNLSVLDFTADEIKDIVNYEVNPNARYQTETMNNALDLIEQSGIEFDNLGLYRELAKSGQLTAEQQQEIIDAAQGFVNSISGVLDQAATMIEDANLENLSQAGYRYDEEGNDATIDEKHIRQQLGFLESTNSIAPEDLDEYTNILNDPNQGFTLAQADAIAQLVKDYVDQVGGIDNARDNVGEFISDLDSQINVEKEKLGSLATNLTELNTYLDGMSSEDTEAYGKSLLGLASGYVECREEINEYAEAVAKSGVKSNEAKTALDKLQKAVKDAEFKKATVAVRDYITELKKLKEEGADTQVIMEAQEELAEQINEAFGTNIDGQWVEDHQQLLNEWVNSTGEAAAQVAERIRALALLDIGDLQPLVLEGKLDMTQVNTIIENFRNYLLNNPANWKLFCEGKLDLQQLLQSLGAGQEAAQILANLLASIGETDLTFEGTGEEFAAAAEKLLELDGATDSITFTPTTDENGETTGGTLTIDTSNTTLLAQALEALGNAGADFGITQGEVVSAGVADTTQLGSGLGNDDSGGNSGGGGGGGSESSPSKPMKRTKKSDIVTRYKQLDDKLDNVNESLQKLQKVQETVWGKKHLDNLREQNSLLEEEIELIDQKIVEAKKYAEEDLAHLKGAAQALGVNNLEINATTGDITNIESVLSNLHEQLAQAEQHYNSLGTGEAQSEYQESTLDPLNEKISLFQEFYEQYMKTIEGIEDLYQEKLDKSLEILNNNFTLWSTEIEIKIELNDDDLSYIEYQLSKIEDDFYQRAEGLILTNDQMDIYLASLDIYKNGLSELDKKYQEGEITQAAYVEGLNTIREGMIDNLGSLDELKKSIVEYYSETLDAAMDEMSKYTDAMEHQSAVLEHYQSILELIGKESDYNKIGEFLSRRTANAANLAKQAKSQWELLTEQAEEYKQLAASSTEETAKMYNDLYMETLAKAQEAQDNYLSLTTEWAEAVKTEFENTISGLSKTLEEALTGGTTFDYLVSRMDMMASLQEEYLTNTNKMYEIEKLRRKAQQEIDKTSNIVAKRKLKDFITGTELLKDQTKVSQFELDIQQAKYDLLLAQIALEEAQNAKSTVRLQRDSSGNFGYVYTADTEKISDAEQAVADTEQKLYQLGLEGFENYKRRAIELPQEMKEAFDELAELYASGEIEAEEFSKRFDEISNTYIQKIKDNEDLKNKALLSDERIIADSWAAGLETFDFNLEETLSSIATYKDGVLEAGQSAKDSLDEIGGLVFGEPDENGEYPYGQIADEILSSSNELSNTLNNDLIPAIIEEITTVNELTQSWVNQLDEINKVIESYEKFIETILEAKKAESGFYGEVENNNKPALEVEDIDIFNGKDPNSISPNTEYNYQGGGGYGNSWMGSYGNSWMGSYSSSSTGSYSSMDWRSMLFGGMMGFDTGGYTGEWGSYGKLGILHEKELILNKDDTKNWLSSIQEINKTLELYEKNLQMETRLRNYKINKNNNELQQFITIEAHFPDVIDHNEIEVAFGNLVNEASQYAYRFYNN